MTRYVRFERIISQWADVEIPDDVDDPEEWRLASGIQHDLVYTALEEATPEVTFNVIDEWEEEDQGEDENA